MTDDWTDQRTPAQEEQATFLVRTYLHLLAAVAAFVGIEMALFRSGLANRIAVQMLSVNWLWCLGTFILVAILFRWLAHKTSSRPVQYVGLALYVVAESIIFVPLLFEAELIAPGTIETAAYVALLGFGAMTVGVFQTRYDFSFLAPFLGFFGLFALGLIVYSCLFGLELGLWFSTGMIVLAVGSTLYDTSAVLLRFDQEDYVGAALELFASMALLFWYVLRWAAEWASRRR